MPGIQHICSTDMVQDISTMVDMVQHMFAKNMLHNRAQDMCSKDMVLAIVSLKSMVTDDWFAVHMAGLRR